MTPLTFLKTKIVNLTLKLDLDILFSLRSKPSR